MIASMAMMESPAIVIGVLLYRRSKLSADTSAKPVASSWRSVLREACLNGSVVLIIGSMAIGWLSGEDGYSEVEPLIGSLFVGMLCLFLLDMGIVAAKQVRDLRSSGLVVTGTASLPVLVGFALLLAIVNGLLAMMVAFALGLSEGDALLFTILGASASYIAVPAAMRLAMPQANPSIYLSMALAITFPFNLLLGIPGFHHVIRSLM
jgi:hypothetical protein